MLPSRAVSVQHRYDDALRPAVNAPPGVAIGDLPAGALLPARAYDPEMVIVAQFIVTAAASDPLEAGVPLVRQELRVEILDLAVFTDGPTGLLVRAPHSRCTGFCCSLIPIRAATHPATLPLAFDIR